MPYYYQISKTSIYQDFINLDDRSYEGVIRFFERNENSIHQLDFWEYFELHAEYCESLFESGKYERFLNACDWLIEKSIEENVHRFKGVDVYQRTVFRKAASLFNIDRPQEAFKIVENLVRMDPKNEVYKLLAQRCFLKEKYSIRTRLKFGGAVILLCCSLLIGFELIVLRRLEMPYTGTVEMIRNILFAVGFMIVVGSEGMYRLTAYVKMKKILRS